MNCKQYQERIDDFLLMEGKQLTQVELNHIGSCEICRDYYEQVRETNKVLDKIKHYAPQLSDPDELTDSIMQSVTGLQQMHAGQQNVVVLITRLLTAAVIALFITLGFEQYFVLYKVKNLETRLENIPKSTFSKNVLIQEAGIVDIQALLNNENDALNLNNLPSVIRLHHIKNQNFTLNDLKRYMRKENIDKSLLEKKVKTK